MKTEAEVGAVKPQAKEYPGIAGNHQKLREARTSPPEPSEGAWACQPLAFFLLASRTVKESVSAVMSLPVCADVLRQPFPASGRVRVTHRTAPWDGRQLGPEGCWQGGMVLNLTCP